MTFIGKLFVMLNVALSLLMAGVGLGLYTSSIDYTERAAKGGEPAGLTAQRKTALKEATDPTAAVEAGWLVANTDLMRREEQRQADQKWAAGELTHVRAGATAANPAREFVIGDDGVPQADKNGRPTLTNAFDNQKKALVSIASYDTTLKTKQAETATQLAQLEKEFKADIDLTNKLVPPKGEKIGLRDQLVQERLKREGIQEETASVEHLATTAAVQSAVIGERVAMLDTQIQVLRRALSRLKGMDGKK